MKRGSSFVILTAASALIACVSEAPGTSTGSATGTATGHANLAAPSTAAANAAAATSSGTTTGEVNAGANASADSQQTKQAVQVLAAKFPVGGGWRRVVSNGEELFCQKQYVAGSHVQTQVSCLTRKQLEHMQTSSQHYLNSVQRMDGVSTGSLNVGGPNLGGR